MTWESNIIGNGVLLKKLDTFLQSQKVPHALLLVGPSGTQKFRIMRNFAKKLHGDEAAIEKNICPTVVSVGDLWKAGKQEDWDDISRTSNFPQQHREKQKKNSDMIGIEDVGHFTKPLFQSSSHWKICMIRDVDRLTTEAANALLNILEEPPEKTVFLLTTSSQKRLPETILSRCQIFSSFLTPQKELRFFLQEQDIPSEEQGEMLTLAQGRAEHLLQLIKKSEFFEEERREFQEIARLFFSPGISAKFQKIEELSDSKNRELIAPFLDNFLRFLRSLLVEKSEGKTLEIAQKLSFSEILNLLSLWEETCFGLRAHGNVKLLLEKLFFAIP